MGPASAAVGPAERSVVERALTVLGVPVPVDGAAVLTAGRSGALVVALDGGLVLKVTSAPERRARAATELAVVADPEVRRRRLVPELVAGAGTAAEVLLLTRRGTALDPATVTPGRWRAIGARIAAVHQTPLPPGATLAPRPQTSGAEVAAAVDQWTRRGEGRAAGLAAEILTARSVPPSERHVLAHGDCHLDNLVLDDAGHLRWIDWQEAHLGDGLGDLVFCCQRAEFAGVAVPRRTVVTAYVEARGLAYDAGFVSALRAAELELLLVAWPPFLAYGRPEQQAAMAARLRWLTAVLAPGAG